MCDRNPIIHRVLTDCVTAFICPRGEFYPDKDYGSRIIKNVVTADIQTLLCYARQAVSEMDGVFVKSAVKEKDNILFNILINHEEGQVSIPVE